MATLRTVDNFDSKLEAVKSHYGAKEVNYLVKDSLYHFNFTSKTNINLELNLKDYLSLENSYYLSFDNWSDDEQKYDKRQADDLILSINNNPIKTDEKKWVVKSGNYIGQFNFDNHTIKIGSRFGNGFLKRMLNVANSVFLSEDISSKKNEEEYLFILYYLFTQKLEKAFLLGIPKVYRTILHHDVNIRGHVDVKRLIREDIPFKGKISTRQRVRMVDQDVVTVLDSALKIVHKRMPNLLQNVHHVYTAIRQQNPEKLKADTIYKAKNSKALTNPIFLPYRDILNLAEIILKSDSFNPTATSENKSFGFVINVAELFERYIFKLLQQKFSDWEVTSPELPVYKDRFYARKIIPDIVMTKGNSVVVFDAKYKRMNYARSNSQNMGDLDRADFFQIHSYMSYYQNRQSFNPIACGLIYPLNKPYDSEKCLSNNLFGNDKMKFVVDGIYLDGGDSEENVLSAEEKFLSRIETLID
ncbi:MAG: hypothetical protein PF486_12045 [Prolixibacteraceae bacterium]|jgi:5-methylcytosine-specific restriction enzyme subunit McrC|nr:hypothetical protein [Prolixibacteraceae bacterium]